MTEFIIRRLNSPEAQKSKGSSIFRNPIVVALCLSAVGLGVGCSTSSSKMSNPPPASVTIAFQPAPPSALTILGTATFAANVSNDPLNLGVDWVLNCSATGNCGSLSSSSASGTTLHTASGTSVTYTPPASLSTNTQVVYIAAFSSADQSKNVEASMSVTGFAGALKGTYVFALSGSESATGLPYHLAGVLVADGNGNITGGEQTYTSSLGTFSDSIASSGSNYTISPDNRGTIILNVGDPNLGDTSTPGVETFSIALLTPQSPQALIGEYGEHTSVGTLELQTSTSPPSGGYAFVVEGITTALDPNTGVQDPLAFGGVLNVDSPGVISGHGSVADEEIGVTNSDGSTNGQIVNSASLSGTVSGADPFGAVTIKLTSTFAPAIQLIGYSIDSTRIQLVESDSNSGSGFGATGGTAVSQGAATGSFTANSAFSGTFAYGVLGQITSSPSVGLSTLAGEFTVDGNGNLTQGFTDQSNLLGVLISDTLTGTYAVDNTGTGRVTANTNYGSNGIGPTLVFYLTGNGSAPLVLDMDTLTLGAGVTYSQQSSSSPLNGLYGLSWARFSPSPFVPFDATAIFTANGTAGSISGTEDGTLGFDQPFSGTFAFSPGGRFTGTLTDSVLNGGPTTSAVAFYAIDESHGLFTETDGLAFVVAYFGAATPICPSCTVQGQAKQRSGANFPMRKTNRHMAQRIGAHY